MNIHGVFSALDQNDQLLRNAPATADEIRTAEQCLCATFPSEYSDWLLLSDGGEICPPGLSLYGVSVRNLSREELLAFENRLTFRRDVLHMPTGLLIIGKLCFGDYICLNMEEGNQVVQWDVENETPFLVWASLCSYLESEWLRREEE